MLDFFLQSFSSLFGLIGPFMILLGVLIVIHELGHLLAAKYFGVRVETFSVGFGKKNSFLQIWRHSLLPLSLPSRRLCKNVRR